MKRKIVSGIMLTLLLSSILNTIFNIIPMPIVNTVDSPNEILINPLPKQYANYSHLKYYPNGTIIWSGWLNISYLSYVEPNLINATHTWIRPELFNGTFWLSINTTNRWVTKGTSWWVDTWYVGWIETNIEVGSVINMWTTTATVVGSKTLEINVNGLEKSIDCWVINYTLGMPPIVHTHYFDKLTGLAIGGVTDYTPWGYDYLINGTLVSTNIPISAFLLGDVNFDEKVDIQDIAMAALAFGSYPSNPRWNPTADVNQDGKVDIRDLILIARNFGKTYS